MCTVRKAACLLRHVSICVYRYRIQSMNFEDRVDRPAGRPRPDWWDFPSLPSGFGVALGNSPFPREREELKRKPNGGVNINRFHVGYVINLPST